MTSIEREKVNLVVIRFEHFFDLVSSVIWDIRICHAVTHYYLGIN